MPYPPLRGRFIWHELMTPDSAAGIAFYKKVVGWKTEAWDQHTTYVMWLGSRGPVGGVMTLPEEAKLMGAPPHWLPYIGTPDIDGTVRQAAGLGAKIYKDIATVPTVGRFAILADPQGAAFAAFTPETLMPQQDQPAAGEFSWHELATSDPAGAWHFYQALFGWEKTEAMDMGPAGVYQMFGWPGLSLGGIYQPPAGMPPNWLSYAMVPDAIAAAEAVKRAGGQVVKGPMQVPGGSWITCGIDPQGAMFAVHSLSMQPGVAKRGERGTGNGKPKKPATKAKKTARKVKKTAKKKGRRPGSQR